MPRFYHFPEDYEYPACEQCGAPDQGYRRILLSQAKGTAMNLVECTVCGLRFFAPRPKWEILAPLIADEREQAERLFTTGSFLPVDDPVVQKANIRSYYDRMLTDVIDHFGSVPGSMFEVGGSVGWFTVAARKRGINFIDGLDLNPHAVTLARQEHNLLGYYVGDFAHYRPLRQYELVVALDYLEHTYTPTADLAKLHRMLAPNGIFLAKTFLDELDVNREQLSPPSHAIHWTTPVLRAALRRAGLDILDWRLDYGGYFVIIIARKVVP